MRVQLSGSNWRFLGVNIINRQEWCKKIITRELLQFGITASASLSNSIIADPSLDIAAIASPTFPAATASDRHFTRAHDIGLYAF
ncbi:hypothetical protein COLO4_14408 [Corchorus olitorius]|uniref:Uncharacterized protein n=1 Tax=Corchorus olitorius TaxID=93759 RepID=A0A1R3JS64_9ROSI|nr:hypothetical protein COLO4_14408 [Corchorus olitorius]